METSPVKPTNKKYSSTTKSTHGAMTSRQNAPIGNTNSEVTDHKNHKLHGQPKSNSEEEFTESQLRKL